MSTAKRCFKCGRNKPRSEFYAHPRMADGLLGKCKECARSDVRANRAARREQYREYEQRRWQQRERRQAAAEYRRRHRERHPERYAARTAVNNAVRDGRLRRLPCEVCGSPKAQAHHEDYARPLDVRWLCFVHHRAAHGQQAAELERAA